MATDSGVTYTTMIRDLPRGERPRERLREHGPSHLSNAELIAILLRTGVMGENVLNLAVRLLAHFQGLSGLARATYGELCSLKGVSDARHASFRRRLSLDGGWSLFTPKIGPSLPAPRMWPICWRRRWAC